MIGIVILLIGSWILMRYFVQDESILNWFSPYRKRGLECLMGFLFIVIVRLIIIGLETATLSIKWRPESLDFGRLTDSLFWHLKSALTEELLFRGALLFLMCKWLGLKRSLLLGSALFGIYHWFSYEMIGGPIIPLLFVLITTGSYGWVWGYTFLKTKSIALPLGLHWAWNFTGSLFYDMSPFGHLIMSETNKVQLHMWDGLIYSFISTLLPVFITWIAVTKYLKHSYCRTAQKTR